MASVRELKEAILEGELKDIAKENQLSRTRAREATTQNTEEYALSSPLHPVNVRIEQKRREIMELTNKEVKRELNQGTMMVLIYTVLLWSFLIWAW